MNNGVAQFLQPFKTRNHKTPDCNSNRLYPLMTLHIQLNKDDTRIKFRENCKNIHIFKNTIEIIIEFIT